MSGNVDITCLKELWSEALCYKNCATEFVFILESEYELPAYMIDFDTFVRMNFRLEVRDRAVPTIDRSLVHR